MFGRRFYDPSEDDYTADGLLPLEPTVDDHLRLLAPVQPLLENADLTVLNLDTVLSDQVFFPKSAPRPAVFHPTTPTVYTSHPTSVIALKQAGVDVVDLGNNHIYDMLEAGMNNTLTALDQAGMLHFGAGSNESNAWAPTVLSLKGAKIAFIGCTTMRIPLQTPTTQDIPYTASDVLRKGGAAYCAEARLRAEVIKAKQQADMVVVMIHGGKEYDPMPTNKIAYLSEIARQAGASLVINHQPDVVGGFQWKDQALTAWTMGNFIADQTLWPSLESCMLAVYVREGKVIRAYVEPLMIDQFIPHGLTDEMADYVLRGAASYDPGPFVIESGAMELDINGQALQHSYMRTIDGGTNPGVIIPIPQAQWISGFKGQGKLQLGRDLLWVGSFENDEVDSPSQGAPLWDLNAGSLQIGSDYAYQGGSGISLARGAKNTGDAVTTHLHRVWIDPYKSLSITGMVRANQGVVSVIQLSWYASTSGPSFLKTTEPVNVPADGAWQPFRLDVRPPARATAVALYLRLKPPDKGTAMVDFDNLRLIQWANPSAPYSPFYNYALLTGSGELTLTQQVLPGAESWLENLPPR
jgi:poly-gamma-glutamate synthesis protein (capsule biosynthesis protein)